jgi:hypothetical protein
VVGLDIEQIEGVKTFSTKAFIYITEEK